jgi:hypothetical protein
MMEGMAMDTSSDDAKPTGHPSDPSEGQTAEDDLRWERDREEAEHTRLARIQSSANVWLGILGTLFGLSGAVVLVKGSTAFITSAHNPWLHAVFIVLVATTFAAAILALMMGGAATWGGLVNLADPQPTNHPVLDWLIEKFGPKDSQKSLKRWRESARPTTYKAKYNRWADRRRLYLHASRGLGITAALLAGIVVIWIFAARTASQASPKIIVVHKGRVTCGTIKTVEKYTGITQVVSVAQC